MFNKMKKKQKETLKRMKKNRQVDSDNLRALIEQKLKWALAEKKKGEDQIKNIRVQIERLNGILLFIQDLKQPPEKIEGKK